MTQSIHDVLTYENLTARLDGRPFRYYESVGSTNDIARDWQMAYPHLPTGTVVIANEQTGGRGRSGRTWMTPPGQAIAMSVVLRPKISADLLHRITIIGGLAVIEAIEPYLMDKKLPPAESSTESRSVLGLKWPNDVLLNGKKLAGVLTEAIWLGNDLQAVILGIGINIRVDFTTTHLADKATSLEAHTPHSPVERLELIAQILQRIDKWEAHLNSPLLVETWRLWLNTLGERVEFRTFGQGIIAGRAKDVDEDGALLILTETGECVRVTVGDVLPVA